jgi:hypothetical protein
VKIQRKFIASAIGFFALLSAAGSVLDYGTDDMHWPTGPTTVVAESVPAGTQDMHWPTGPTSADPAEGAF